MDISQAWESAQAMFNSFLEALPKVALGVIIFAMFYFVAHWVKMTAQRIAQAADLTAGAEMVVGRLSRWAVISLGFLLALNVAVPSFTMGELIQLLGIGSVAIGFAFHDILQNFLAGILLLLTEPFRIGDQIVVNDFEGTVENIETRATMLTTYDGRRIVIPNSNLFTESVVVNTAFPVRRSEYRVGIGYDEDIGQAMTLMLDTMRSVEGVLLEPAPDVLVAELGNFTVDIRARWWTDSRRANALTVQSEVISAIKERLMAQDIDMPFPTQEIIFHNRALQREAKVSDA